jgi:hypothetical protein
MDSLANRKDLNIVIENERKFWLSKIINVFIIIPKKCEKCKRGNTCLRKNNSIINPFFGKCNFYKYNNETYLGKNTIFHSYNKTPVSIIYNILDLWLNSEFNAAKISVKLGEL